MDYVMFIDCDKPFYSEAMLQGDKRKWAKAMKLQMKSLIKNGTWYLLSFLQEKHFIAILMGLQAKITLNDVVLKYTIELVAKAFEQEKGLILMRLSH